MRCGLHDHLKQRFFNGNCLYCRKAEIELLRELQEENGLGKVALRLLNKPITRTVSSISRRKVASLTRGDIQRPIRKQPKSDDLMSYDEIGERMGISGQRAHQLCESGLRKLRHQHPKTCQALLELSLERRKCLGEAHAS